MVVLRSIEPGDGSSGAGDVVVLITGSMDRRNLGMKYESLQTAHGVVDLLAAVVKISHLDRIHSEGNHNKSQMLGSWCSIPEYQTCLLPL
jgi:hypothetical protein